MANNRPLRGEERLQIVDVLKKGNLSHREIAKRFKRAQSTISSIARDAGITPTHRRRRTPAARDVESTYSREERIIFVDRIIGALGAMVDAGGLSPKETREVTQAAKVALDARRSEDIEPEENKKDDEDLVSIGLGDMRVDPNTYIGREMLKLEKELVEGDEFASPHVYGAVRELEDEDADHGGSGEKAVCRRPEAEQVVSLGPMGA
jgi:hypothetical protein